MTGRLTGIVVAACLAALASFGCNKTPPPPPPIAEPTAAVEPTRPGDASPPAHSSASGDAVVLPSQSPGEGTGGATARPAVPPEAAPPASWPLERKIDVGFGVSGAAFSPDGATLVVVGPRGLKCFSTADGSPAPAPTGADKLSELSCVAYSADGARLAVGQAKLSAPGRIFVWDAAANGAPQELEGHQKLVAALAWGGAGHDLLVSGGSDWLVLVWDLAKKAPRQTFRGHNEYVTSVSVSPDGKSAASVGGDRFVFLWDLATPQMKKRLTGHFMTINSVAYAPDGKTLVSGSGEGAVIFWDAARGVQAGSFYDQAGAVTSLAYRPAGDYVASGWADKRVRVLDANTRKLAAVLEGHDDYVNVVAFSRDGRWLASGGEDGRVAIWKAPESSAAKP